MDRDTIEDYQILNMIGKGGFACVYRGLSVKSGKPVAVKMINKKLMKSNGMIDRVKKEVEIHSRLNHPSILQLYSYCEDSEYVYLILEICSNGELFKYIDDREQPLDETQVQSFMRQIVSGMQYLHTHGILHRDLSLTNLLLTEDLKVKIADFGLATQLTQPGEQHFTLCGTPNYISPEVASHSAHSLETDLWSLGCMFYTMLVGKPPFDTEGAKPTLKKVLVGEYELPAHLSRNACDLIKSLLQRKPSDRLKVDQVLSHPFFTNSLDQRLQRSESEDSAYCTIDVSNIPDSVTNSAESHLNCLKVSSKQGNIVSDITQDGDSQHVANGFHDLNDIISELMEPEFTSTPVIERPTKCMQNPVAVAELNFSSPVINKNPPLTKAKLPETLRSMLRTLDVQCRLFLKQNKFQSYQVTGLHTQVTTQKQSTDELNPHTVSTQVLTSGGILSSPTTDNKCLEPGLKPLTSERLRPIRQRTRNAIVNILDSGEVCLEFLKLRSPVISVSEVMKISTDGEQVTVYRPAKGSVVTPADLSDSPVEIPSYVTPYTYKTLPKKYWRKYSYAARFVHMVKSKTPKVTYFSNQAKCMLMESQVDFEAVFYSGPKFSITSQNVKVIDTSGMNISFSMDAESSLLSSEVQSMWQHVKKCKEHCQMLEQMLHTPESSPTSDCCHFPVILGSRWSANNFNDSSNNLAEASCQCDTESLPPPTMRSFDGSITSHATTVNPPYVKPLNVPQPPQPQQTTSASMSNGSSLILLRRYFPNVGWANQMSNGAICVQFDDSHQLTVYSHKSEVLFVYRNGVIARYTETDIIPDIVRNKLESLVHVVNSLAS